MSQLSSPQQAQDPDALYHLGYVSTEAVKFSDEALIALLTEARNANTDRNVTGLLLYRKVAFTRCWKAVNQPSWRHSRH
jgi:hypothetical protein